MIMVYTVVTLVLRLHSPKLLVAIIGHVYNIRLTHMLRPVPSANLLNLIVLVAKAYSCPEISLKAAGMISVWSLSLVYQDPNLVMT